MTKYYRLLNDEETIREGDEVMLYPHNWQPVSQTIGDVAMGDIVRRRMDENVSSIVLSQERFEATARKLVGPIEQTTNLVSAVNP